MQLHALQRLAHGQQPGGVGDLRRDRLGRAAGEPPADHLGLALGVQVAEPDPGGEPVQLGLGQRVGALVLDRVVGGEHHERLRQRPGDPVRADLALCHRLEQGRLGLGRGPVDLVGQQQAGEDRAGPEHRLTGGQVEHGGAGQVGGQHVRGELDPGELQAEHRGERAGQQRLAEARQVLDQDVAGSEHAEQHQAHRLRLAHDDPLDFGHDLLAQPRCLGDRHRQHLGHESSSSSAIMRSSVARSGPGPSASAGRGGRSAGTRRPSAAASRVSSGRTACW